jgi:hypothetical protein
MHQKVKSQRSKSIANIGWDWDLVDDPHTDIQVALESSVEPPSQALSGCATPQQQLTLL